MLVKYAFHNKKQFKKHLKRFCVKNNWQFKCKKSCSKQVRAHCRFKDKYDYKWCVYASRVDNESTFAVRSVNLEHTCVGDKKGFNTSADPELVKDVVIEKLRHSYGSFIPKPRNILEDFAITHNIKIPYICEWKARNLVLEEFFGNYEESYAEVPKFYSMVSKTNPGSVAKFIYGRKDFKFESMTISFAAPMKAFQESCRGVVEFDACHLTGKWGGVLMDATTLDDQQKGLLEAVAEVFPGSPDRYCWRHNYKNFKKYYKSPTLHSSMWNAAKCYKIRHFEENMAAMYK
ncbi:uncharacterized protein LOC113302882 isoform X2 [Papaver somniferum]|uniref:uncharacterized protein LOC113302882 isoform X2 n=1 Tax=Papaver somniferum TaxID=3469 RepID=UPI000E6FA947|nr:uncharacterized protein LOC113302882 isoform X2 [Papaver somniferum]